MWSWKCDEELQPKGAVRGTLCAALCMDVESRDELQVDDEGVGSRAMGWDVLEDRIPHGNGPTRLYLPLRMFLHPVSTHREKRPEQNH